jgi:hypothetical protein
MGNMTLIIDRRGACLDLAGSGVVRVRYDGGEAHRLGLNGLQRIVLQGDVQLYRQACCAPAVRPEWGWSWHLGGGGVKQSTFFRLSVGQSTCALRSIKVTPTPCTGLRWHKNSWQPRLGTRHCG